MPKKGRYAHLKGSSAYYPFGARTSLRKKQRMRVVLLRLLGLALIVPVALFLVRQIFFNGGQPKPPIGVTATPETASSGPVSVTVQPATVNAPQNVQTPESTAETENAILPKYQDLYAQNSDLVGWLTIDAIGVDYPVMQTPGDNEYYLRRGFDKLYSLAGSLFLDENCRITSPSTANWLIYGHNMSDGSMFGQLDKYAEESFYREHPTFEFDTLYEEMQWQIVAVIRTQVGADDLPYYTFFDASSERDWQAKYQAVMDLALYDTGVTAQYGDQLLTLSTCGTTSSTTDKRLAVVAKRID
ncbi:MAG TPA: class B sortase [Candidatus Gemmiger faecavium]|nr:class B sortase [Candidatus Gemmiger faecavium]